MSTFVVSLFLPYTVDFHDLPSPARRPSSPARVHSLAESVETSNLVNSSHGRRSSADLSKLQDSLLRNSTPPRTPAATARLNEFFSQVQPSAATHFVKPNDPRTLVRSDSHYPEWGQAAFFNQPSAKPHELPPQYILGYNLGPDEAEERARKLSKPVAVEPQSKNSNKRHHSRSQSGENRWATKWNIRPALQGNGGLANAVKAANESGTMDNIIWLGTMGFPTDSLPEGIRDEITETLESEYNALPVFVSDADFDGHYSHFCKTILWPVFHYQIPDHPKSKAYEDHSYKFYHKLNEAFAETIVASYKRGDVIWIHDYHLLLVPGLVRQKLPDAKIGFFLHTAFPSSEVFRCLAMRTKLLEGMLGANMIAFQRDEYCEHFVTTVSRLLRVPTTLEGVEMEDHFVDVTSLPIGIDPKSLDEARADPEVTEWINVMEERYKDKFLIVARDRLDNIRGVRQKLLAYELFLNKNPDWIDKVVLIQVATPSTDQEELASTVSDIVTRIDVAHSTLAHQPLVFLRQDIVFPQYLALLSVADLLMITSLREGMNLTPHEFVVCQDGKLSSKKHAPVIMSEFTGSASVFGDAGLTINPWDYKQTSNAILTALEMPEEEKKVRYEKMRETVFGHTGAIWMSELDQRLNKAYEDRYQRDTKSTPRLNLRKLQAKYVESKFRLFFLDYEGTLASFAEPANIHLSSPQRVLDALNDLVSDPRNVVYVMSGRMPEELGRVFDRVPGLGVIAENGCFVRQHGTPKWTTTFDTEKMDQWKRDVRATLQYYQERIEGHKLEERHCSLLFSYKDVKDEKDQATAERLMSDCANHINDACASQHVHAIHADKGIIIEQYDFSKGSAAKQIFTDHWGEHGDSEAKNGKPVPDFLFVAGDDREDEAVFRWANEIGKTGQVATVTTVSVGKKATEAIATLTQGTSGLLSVLQKLCGNNRVR